MTHSSSGVSKPRASSSPAADGHRSPLLFVRNRRDGARLLSSTLVVAVIGLVGWEHWIGRVVGLGAGALSLFWWLQYRTLRQ